MIILTVDFYTISDANNVVNKTLDDQTKTTVQNVDIFKPSSVESPSLVLHNFTGVSNKNYVYIDKFSRYYFITGITFTSAERVIINLSVDVLYTYASQIKSCKATAIRNENIGKNYITDSKYPVNTLDRYVTLDNFPDTPFTRNPTFPYILTTIGG